MKEQISPWIVLPLWLLSWVAISSLVSHLSGWFQLMKAFPDRSEHPLLTLRFRSGRMGSTVSMRSVLWLSACESGLRVGILKIFGIFCKDFFVPWNALAVTRGRSLFFHTVELRFGSPSMGRLLISERDADQLAKAAGDRLPEWNRA